MKEMSEGLGVMSLIPALWNVATAVVRRYRADLQEPMFVGSGSGSGFTHLTVKRTPLVPHPLCRRG